MAAVGFAWLAQTPERRQQRRAVHDRDRARLAVPRHRGHLLLAFPSGRLERRAERWVVAGGYFVVTVLQVPSLLFEAGEPDDLHNLLVVTPDQPLSDRLDALQFVGGAGPSRSPAARS